MFFAASAAMTIPGRFSFTVLLLLLTGCSEPFEQTDAVRITAEVGDRTRTSMSGSTASFTSGDNIGVFETLTGRSNVSYTYNGSAWSTASPMYWRDGTSNHIFYAYYPYTATTSGLKVGIPTLSTQTIATTVNPALDLLVAGSLPKKRTSSVGLIFTHAYSLIQFNIKMGILQIINPFYLNRITIQGGNSSGGDNRYGIVNITGNPAKVAYDFSEKDFWAASNDSKSYAQSFYTNITGVSLLTTSITFYALVLPGTYTNPVPTVSFQITTLGVLKTTSPANLSNSPFQPRTKYVYNVSVGLLTRSGEPEVTVSACEPVPWEDR